MPLCLPPQLVKGPRLPIAGRVGVIQLGRAGRPGRGGGGSGPPGLFPPADQAQPLQEASSAAVETAPAVSFSHRGSPEAMLLAEPSFHAPRNPM